MRKIKNARSKLISTHTLRGERDYSLIRDIPYPKISTHTLRGERDNAFKTMGESINISTHTLRGERDSAEMGAVLIQSKFQLTRSVGSVTKSTGGFCEYTGISTHTLRGERDSTYCICEVTPPQQSGHFTKNHFKKRYFLHNMYYFFSEPPYKTNITARSLTKSNCPQDHMFPLHLYDPLSSSNYYPDNRIEGYLVLHQ